MNTSLSSLSEIQSTVRPATGGFSFVKTLESFVNNLQFSRGYGDFVNGSETPQSYVWKCLSAVGDDLGELIYSNVAGYVDYVSNVDICKVKSLRSMMNEFGFDYTIFDNIEQIPVEVLNLIDILSINRKYLFDSKYLKDAFDRDLSSIQQKYVKTDFVSRLSGYYDAESPGVMRRTDDDNAVSCQYRYFRNSFSVAGGGLLPTDSVPRVNRLTGVYQLKTDNGYELGPADVSAAGDIVVSREYRNRSGCAVKRFLFKDEYDSGLSGNYMYGLFYSDPGGGDVMIGAMPAERFQPAVTPFSGGNYCSVDAFFDGDSQYADRHPGLAEFGRANGDVPLQIKYLKNGTSYNPDYIDDGTYRCFVEQLYSDLLSGFLTMTYQDAGNTNEYGEPLPETLVALDVCRSVEYNPLSGSAYGNIEDNYQHSIDRAAATVRSIKDSNNIPISFDETGIVDAIENGLDSLDNYTGARRRLLEFVIAERAKPYNSDVSAKAQLDDRTAGIQQVTRYAYYKKMKVLEIARFIDNKYYTDTYGTLSGEFIYDFDTNYNEIKAGQISNCLSVGEGGALCINEDMLASVARSLADTTFYITKLRDRMKIQARKNYMKGTNNLLTYVINEFLVDYSRLNRKLFEADELAADADLSAAMAGIRGRLSAHSVNDIAVNEYYDMTEYFNISTEYSPAALDSTDFKNPNQRFWQDGSADEDGLQFGLDEIDRFYLSTLNIADGTNKFGHAIEFLSGIYDVGANKSYFSPRLSGMFTARISAGTGADGGTLYRDTDSVYDQLSALSCNYGDFKLFLSAEPDYEYDRTQTVQEQIDAVYEHIRGNLSAEWCDSVSALRDSYIEKIENLSSDFEQLKGQLDDFLSGEYAYYYAKSDNKYCYIDHNPDGVYGPDYYIDNPNYVAKYYIEKLENVTKFSSSPDNIRNYPILCTVAWLDERFDTLCADFIEQIAKPSDDDHPGIESWGWVDINALTLDDEFNNAKDFLDGKVNQRLSYLQAVVDALRVQANELQSHYESVKNAFNGSVAAYKSQYLDKMGEVYPDYTLTANMKGYPYTTSGDDEDYAYTDMYSEKAGGQKYYDAKEDDDGNPTGKYDRGSNTEMDCTPSESDSLEDLIVKFDTWISQGTGGRIVCIEQKDDDGNKYVEEVDRETYTKYMDAGVKSAIANTQASLREIDLTYDSVVGQLRALGYDGPDQTSDRKTNIDKLIEYVTVEIDESKFEQDERIQAYKEYIKRIIQLSAEYLPVRSEYESIRNDSSQTEYLVDYLFDSDFTKINIASLCSFAVTKDAKNKKDILNRLSGYGDTYYGYVDTYMVIGTNLASDSADDPVKIRLEDTEFIIGGNPPITNTLYTISEYQINTDVLEKQLEDIDEYLLQNIDEKYDTANYWVDEISYRISNDSQYEPGFLNVITPEISSSLSTAGVTFAEAVEKRLADLNFFEHADYRAKRDMFLTYSGLSCGYDPYYNHKNQIHSSYQIHPYLWNFMLTTYDVNPIAVAFDRLTLDDLEGLRLAEKYGGYYGRYGEVLSVAEHNLVDATGYVTRYENSKHRHEGAYGECVDYDGAFYPPAVEAYIADKDAAVRSVRAGEGEFYERFYAHLGLEPAELEEIASQLDSYYLSVQNIVSVKQDLSAVHDIYRYGLDADENSYILYKRYSQPSPTYQERKNTRGQLWVRKNDHPIAFPAFFEHGAEIPNVVHKIGDELVLNSRIDMLDPSMPDAFYDFRLSDGGGGILLVAARREDQSGTAYTDPRGYDRSDVIISKISYEYDDRLKKTVLRLDNDSRESDRMYISDFNRDRFGDTDATLSYVDAFSKDANSVEIIGLFRNPDGTIYQDASGFVHGRRVEWYPNGDTRTFAIRADVGYRVTGRDAVIGFHAQGKAVLQMAFVVDTGSKYSGLSSYTDQTGIDIASASDGPVRHDPSETEMNSFDSFGQKVVVVTFDRNCSDRKCPAVYDMNADMSYLPVYPEKAGVAEIWRTDAGNDEFKSVELLGMSKDIDGLIAGMNPDADPYFDYDSILSSYTFGRVYEDFLQSMDKTLVRFSNPILNNWTTEKYGDGEFVTWSSNIQSRLEQAMGPYVSPFDPRLPEYTDRDLKRLKLVVYSKGCLGKNPYFVCDLAAITVDDPVNEWVPAYYMPLSASASHSAVTVSDGEKFVVDGTTDQAAGTVDFSTNRLKNIDGVMANFTKSDRTLRIRFRIAGGMEPGSVFIARDSIEVALFNHKDLSLFRYYHMLDAYGAVCSQYHQNYLTDYYEIHEPPGWAVFKDISEFPQDYFLPSYKSCYFRDDEGKLTLHDGSYELSHPVEPAKLHDWVTYAGAAYEYDTSVYLKEWYFPTTREGDPSYYHSGYVSVNMWILRGAFPAGAAYKGESLTDPRSAKGVNLAGYIRGTTAYEHPLSSDLAHVQDRTIYLKDLKLEDYDFLSDVYVLGCGPDESAPQMNQYGTIDFVPGRDYSGHNRLQYKYDEELRFNLDHELYYYPTLNFKYPRTTGQYLDSGRLFNIGDLDTVKDAQKLNFLDGVFDGDNVYAMQLEDAAAVLSSLGEVEVPISYVETECYHALEEYLSADGSGSPNYEKYDTADPRTLGFVRFTEKGSGTAAGETLTVDDELLKVKDDEQIAEFAAASYGVYPRKMEKNADTDIVEYASLSVDSDVVAQLSADFPSLTRVYVNYNKDMTLYFNYFNFLNCPYVKIEDNRTKMDVIDGTYLKLAPGENGTLDVVVQFKYALGNTVYGVRNAKIASYRIWNVSDDKPKFVMKRTHLIKNGDLKREDVAGVFKLDIPDIDLNVDSGAGYSDPDTVYGVGIAVKRDKEFGAGSYFYLTYPNQLLDYYGGEVQGVTIERVSYGVLKITVDNPGIWRITVPFKGGDGSGVPVPLASRTAVANKFYMMTVDDYAVTDSSGFACELDSNIASVIIRSTAQVVASTEESTGTIQSGTGISVIVTEDSPTAEGQAFRAVMLQDNTNTF